MNKINRWFEKFYETEEEYRERTKEKEIKVIHKDSVIDDIIKRMDKNGIKLSDLMIKLEHKSKRNNNYVPAIGAVGIAGCGVAGVPCGISCSGGVC